MSDITTSVVDECGALGARLIQNNIAREQFYTQWENENPETDRHLRFDEPLALVLNAERDRIRARLMELNHLLAEQSEEQSADEVIAPLSVVITSEPSEQVLELVQSAISRTVHPGPHSEALAAIHAYHVILRALLSKDKGIDPVAAFLIWGADPIASKLGDGEAPEQEAKAAKTDEVQAAAKRLTPLMTEDGDWLIDPESQQFHDDIRTLVEAVGVEPVKHSYGG